MRVSVTDPEVVGPTASFEEIPVVVGGADPRTTRGGIVVTPGDFNPERVTLDDGQNTASIQMPAADTGDRLVGHRRRRARLLVRELQAPGRQRTHRPADGAGA